MRAVSTPKAIKPHAVQSEQKQTSEAANSYYTIKPPDPHFSLKHFLMTEQTNLNNFCVWLLGGRLVIISLSCYSMSGRGGGGVRWGRTWRSWRGWWAFAENIIGMAPVTLSFRLCCASLCAFTGPLRCFIKQEAGPQRRCLCSLCGSTTQWAAIQHPSRHKKNLAMQTYTFDASYMYYICVYDLNIT